MTAGPASRDKHESPRPPLEAALSAPIRIAVAGALGRMGRALSAAVEDADGLVLAARYDRPGLDGDGLTSLDDALSLADVVLDFTTPQASVALARAAAARGGPALVIGSTGLSDEDRAEIARAAGAVPVVFSGNYSLGVNLLAGLTALAARALGPDAYDIEIFEAHHKRKVDAPSGTALMLGDAASAARGTSLREVEVRARDGITGARPPGAIGFSVMRGGGIVGEHSVSFVAEDEIITLSHSARDRSLFARGAVAAARWVKGRPAGQYDMQDVLGLRP